MYPLAGTASPGNAAASPVFPRKRLRTMGVLGESILSAAIAATGINGKR